MDPVSADRLIMAAADLHAEMHTAGEQVDLPLVRRAAAMMIFGTGAIEPGPVLREDWPILFS